VNGSLLVTDEDLAKGSVRQFIEKGEDSTARVVKQGIHPFFLQTLHNDLRTGLLH
jgi:hypothetical protein